jgi:H3 lysine-79-specific histone-lysine N-methyltransferase
VRVNGKGKSAGAALGDKADANRYDLVDGKDKINSIDEIYQIAEVVAEVYLTEAQKEPFTEPNTGIVRQIQKAMNMLTMERKNRQDSLYLNGFKKAVDKYNNALEGFLKDGRLAKNLDNLHRLPDKMIRLILLQVYERAVSPEVEQLRVYENGSDNVYGELKPPFVSKILQQTKLKSDHIFVDLGSGVGNVVLQAALEIGCESIGCEMMKNPYTIANKQKEEFEARCRLWGVRPGRVTLEQGDFKENEVIATAIRTADVILVNNEVFSAETNDFLIRLFIACRDGCQVVSLKEFVAPDHKITKEKLNDPKNQWRSVKGYYYSNDVSWTDRGGEYFVMTKDEKRLARYHNKFINEEKSKQRPEGN